MKKLLVPVVLLLITAGACDEYTYSEQLVCGTDTSVPVKVADTECRVDGQNTDGFRWFAADPADLVNIQPIVDGQEIPLEYFEKAR